jgi:hypothetical protein
MSRQFRAISIVVALAAIAVVVISHRHHDRTAIGGPADVLVASKLIQKGTTGDAIRSDPGLYSVVSVPPSELDSGAIIDPATLGGKVALTNIGQGRQLTAADFGPSTPTSFPGAFQRAVVVTPSKEIGGRIAVGSYVDVWAAATARSKLRNLERNLQVLAIRDNGRKVTLRVTPRQAGKLVHATTDDRLVLRPDR